MLKREDILHYEVASSWWAGFISSDLGHTLVGKYYAWKVRRKFARYERHMKVRVYLKSQGFLK